MELIRTNIDLAIHQTNHILKHLLRDLHSIAERISSGYKYSFALFDIQYRRPHTSSSIWCCCVCAPIRLLADKSVTKTKRKEIGLLYGYDNAANLKSFIYRHIDIIISIKINFCLFTFRHIILRCCWMNIISNGKPTICKYLTIGRTTTNSHSS